MEFAYLAAGLVLLFIGGEAVVRGAVTLSERWNLSKLFIGLIIVAFGTSTPELVVSIMAVNDGQTDLAVGNIVGSNISNILLVLGLGAVISPIAARRFVVFRDGFTLLFVTGLFVWFGMNIGTMDRQAGVLMLAILLFYMTIAYFSERISQSPAGDRALYVADRVRISLPTFVLDFVLIAVGIAALLFGSQFLIRGALSIARFFEVSDAVIGLSVVAVGTSLPELATVIVAALKRQTELVVGSVIGSNIFNILVVLATTSLISDVYITSHFKSVDLMVLMGATLVLIPFLWTNWRLSRFEGLLMVLFYAGYIYVLFHPEFAPSTLIANLRG